MAYLVYENVTAEEHEAIEEGKIHYHIMKDDKANVGDILSFNITSGLTGEVTPTKDVFRITHVLKHDQCPHIAAGYAVCTIKRLVEAKK